MFYYYLKLASKSIKRTPWLSGLMMLAIALMHLFPSIALYLPYAMTS